VLVRILALLLAVMMMTGTVAEVWASPDVTSVVDDTPDIDSPVPLAEVAPPMLEPRLSTCTSAPLLHSTGRMHAVLVFRPPRLVASR
jgi:hypothetical protein